MVQTRDTAAHIVVGPIVLVGMMGVGKTSVGVKLAELLDFEHVDSDAEIEKAANRSITDIFAEFGEAHFREGEVRVMERLLAAKNAVISTGGGAFIQDAIREQVKKRAISVWLDASPELIWDHVRLKPGRPLLAKPNPQAIINQLCAERADKYAMADMRVEVREGMDQTTVAKLILNRLKTGELA